MNQKKWDRRFLSLAEFISQWSKDPSTKVGAVIVEAGKRIVSLGFNGFAQSMPDRLEFYLEREEKYSRIVHGEINALIFARRSVEGMTLYTYPFMPCDRCAVQMIQAGIKRVVAPMATEEQLKRWGRSFEKTRQYFSESGVELLEINFSLLPGELGV